MTVLKIEDFQHIQRRSLQPISTVDDIVPISWWQADAVEIDMCCVDCLWRWTEIVPVNITRRPEWMGLYDCPAPDCGGEGTAVRG